jgi:lipopolysaccharide export system protein LptC
MQDTPVDTDQAETAEDRLTLLQNKERSFLLSGGVYTYLVRFFRLLLPLVAIAIVAMVFAWPSVEEPIVTPSESDLVPQSVAKNEVLNPRFESQDSKNQPFTLTADSAVQSSDNEDIVLLDKPMADITLNSGSWIAIQSDSGVYERTDEQLMLEGNVKLYHDKGYEVQFDTLWIDMVERIATTDSKVEGYGPVGKISAGGLETSMNDNILIFKGPVKLTLNRKVEGLDL